MTGTKSRIYSTWRNFPKADWDWPNFKPQEMACKGDGSLMIDARAMGMLQELRNRVGRPLVIHSAYRSPRHNANVGGAPRSRHMLGEAFDIRIAGHDPHELEELARAVGFCGIGRYPESATPFLHVDARRPEEAATWGDPFPFGEDDPAPFSGPVAPRSGLPSPRPREERNGGLFGFMRSLPGAS